MFKQLDKEYKKAKANEDYDKACEINEKKYGFYFQMYQGVCKEKNKISGLNTNGGIAERRKNKFLDRSANTLQTLEGILETIIEDTIHLKELQDIKQKNMLGNKQTEQTYRAKVVKVYDKGFIVEGIGKNNNIYQMDVNFDGQGEFDAKEQGINVGDEYNMIHGDELKVIRVHKQNGK